MYETKDHLFELRFHLPKKSGALDGAGVTAVDDDLIWVDGLSQPCAEHGD